jgi:NTP pyrophosphatase (non-canonical NTP hydrolase)
VSKTLDWYQAEARRTAPRDPLAYPEPVRRLIGYARQLADLAPADKVELEKTIAEVLKIHDVLIWGLGLTGEAGEVADLLKKQFGHGKSVAAEKIKLELGDVKWYGANLADAFGFPESEVAEANVAKLRARYPEGFTVAAAEAKADERPKFCGGEHCFARLDGSISHDLGTCPAAERTAATDVSFDANGSPVERP